MQNANREGEAAIFAVKTSRNDSNFSLADDSESCG